MTDIRAITLEETLAFRRRVRAGFGQPETSDDDPAWAADATQPVDRALAAFDREQIVATLRSFPTELTVPGGATVDAGALTAVTCQPTHRRQGLLTSMITRDLRGSAERGEVADVLIASEYPIYGRFGYGPAVQATTWELDKGKASFTYGGSGTVEIIANDTLRKEAPPIFERVRAVRPGMIARRDLQWDHLTDLRRPPEEKPWKGFRVLCRDDDGVPQGWASWTVKDKWEDMRPQSVAHVDELCAATPAAEARLWRFLAELDLIVSLRAGDRPVDEVLPFLLDNGRAAREAYRGDFLWVRLLDVVAALQSRAYGAEGRLVLDVKDPLDIAEGRYLLDATSEGASCTRTDRPADLTLPVRTLGAVYLGGLSVTRLHAAGWLDEETPGAAALADRLFASAVRPWCNTWF
ncbi:MAG TPA: GNAT family N-acetyltransferase [Nocardioidaceae bacterium]|nr:GNAT family N-acetyltransferase [Nocardioidaceae bacterium]